MNTNPKTVDRYVMVEGKTPGSLQTIVEQHIKKGFQPYGPILQVGTTLHQCMVVYRPTIGFLAVVDADTPTTRFDDPDGGEGYFPDLYASEEPFIIRNVVGNWVREIKRSQSPYTIPDTPVKVTDQDGVVLLQSNVSSVKGDTLVVYVDKGD